MKRVSTGNGDPKLPFGSDFCDFLVYTISQLDVDLSRDTLGHFSSFKPEINESQANKYVKITFQQKTFYCDFD